MKEGLGGVGNACRCVRVCACVEIFFCEGNEKRFRVLGSHLPKCVVDNGESEFEILHDPIDPAVLKALSGGKPNGGRFLTTHIPSTTVST